MPFQFRWDVEITRIHHLVARRLFRIRRQAVVLQTVAGQPRDVLHGKVHHSMLGNRSVAVSQHPTLVEVSGLLFADLPGNLIERLWPPRRHRECHSNLFLRQVPIVQRVDTAGV